MKSFVTLILFFILSSPMIAQQVKMVSFETFGEKIIISYQLPNIDERFTVDVKVYCSVNDGEKFLLEYVKGDVGSEVIGGKETYKIYWSWKKQIERFRNVQFDITADLVKMTDSPASLNHRKWYIGYNGSFGFEKQSLGWRIGYFKKIGGYAALSIEPDDPGVGTATLGVTLRLLDNRNTNLYGYFGTGIGDFFDELTVESGLIASFHGLSIAVGSNIEFGVFESNLVVGFGFMF